MTIENGLLMTREIKFRAWHKNWGSFANLKEDSDFMAGFNEEGGIYIINNGYPDERNKDFVIQQWTGLLDKQGRETFEGDVVKITFGIQRALRIYIGVIKFHQPSASYVIQGDSVIIRPEDKEMMTTESLEQIIKHNNSLIKERIFRFDETKDLDEKMIVEVIGNIFENPELI